MRSTSYPLLHPEMEKHHSLIIALHWGTLLCIVIAVATILLREIVEDKYWRLLLIDTHRQLGLLVLFSVVVRLAVRFRHGMMDHTGGSSRPMRFAAVSAHWSLYVLLVGLPLLGWATTNAHNLQVWFIGLIHLPALVEVDSELADQLSDYHVLGSWILLGVVALHALAALYHHYIRRDRVLWAMLPRKGDDNLVSMSEAADGNVELFG